MEQLIKVCNEYERGIVIWDLPPTNCYLAMSSDRRQARPESRMFPFDPCKQIDAEVKFGPKRDSN